MARDTSSMAGTVSGAAAGANKDPSATSAGVTGSQVETVKKAKKPAAPQKRLLHIFYKPTTGADGQPAIEIVDVMGDARKVIDFMDKPEYQSQGIKRYKYEMVSTPRGAGDATDGASE